MVPRRSPIRQCCGAAILSPGHARRWVVPWALAAAVAGCSSGDRVDPGFDARVENPAYREAGPRVLFDEAHRNGHRARTSYRPFVRLVEADGYRVERNTRRITPGSLEPFAVLVVANALGTNDRNDDPAFEATECDAIRDWVAAGGGLLLVTDHYPTGHAAEALAARFGVRLSKGQVEDPLQHDRAFEATHLIFSRENGGLPEHPITGGRTAAERVGRVLTFTGQALHADPPAVPFLRLSPTALARAARPSVERRGGDVIVSVTYVDPAPVPGWSQGLALTNGKGRVVVLGEAGMLTARFSAHDGRPIGMNTPAYDNRQLALNILRWLTGVI
jgi:hypothetical protein